MSTSLEVSVDQTSANPEYMSELSYFKTASTQQTSRKTKLKMVFVLTIRECP